MKITSTQYRIEQFANWQNYTTKIERLVASVKEEGSQLLLLPEYAGLEMAFSSNATDLQLFTQLQTVLPKYLEFYQDLAQRYEIYLQPGTIVVETQPQFFHNRAYFFGPKAMGFQDKLRLVESEKETDLLRPGTAQTIFETKIGTIGIAICYDSEFPEIVRKLVYKGAQLILVPCFTPSRQSFNRVYYSCRARAIENQCYILMACAVGNYQFTDTFYSLTGQANLFSPIDENFTEDGVVSQGAINAIATMTTPISYEKLQHVRDYGQVLNFKDGQFATDFAQLPIKNIAL